MTRVPPLKDCPDYPQCQCTDKCLRLRNRPPAVGIQELARKLIGTTGPTELLDEFNDLERWECRQLDMLAFACTGCGWWFAANERKTTVDDEWVCPECYREGRR